MKKLLLFFAISILTLISHSPNVSALDLGSTDDVKKIILTKDTQKEEAKKEKIKEYKKIKPVLSSTAEASYVVSPTDDLATIASKYQTTIQRLWDKNPALGDPNVLDVGITVSIPLADEVIADRPLPYLAIPVVDRPSGGLNLYYAGQCTWGVKNRRPDIPNSLGNADTWYTRATALGLPTGLVPRVGAAAQAKGRMHVGYVEAVYADGTILFWEMNYDYVPYHTREVIKSASDYYYIY